MDITSKIRKLNRIYLPVLIFNILLLATCLNSVQGADNIEVKQDLIISAGSFGGDAELYNEYNQGQIPSLSPHIEYKTTMKGNFVEEGQYSLKFLLSAGEKKDEYLDLQYQNFGFKIGSQVYDIPIYGFNYRKRLEGMKGYYQSDKLQLEIFDSFQQSRYTEVKLQGNDSIGPYFVGHKDILQNSEKVYIDGVKQTRGEDQGDYYMDYEGGFIYFNKIVLEQEEIKISFEYELEEKEYRGKLYGGDLSYQLNESMTVEGYFLNDNLPLKEDSIYKEAGYKNQTVGVSLITNRKNYYLKNALLFTNLNKKKLDSLPVVESLVVNSGEPKQEIVLKHSPVLYESEKILTEKGEELERNLDYRVLYNKGKIIFNKEFARDQVLEVSYEYLDSSGKLITEQKEGFKNTNLFSYQNKTVAGKTKLDYYVGEFTDFNVLQEVPLKLNLESENKYNFNRQWTGLLDYKLIDSGKSGEENNYSTSVGLDYNNNNNFTGSLKYNRKHESDSAGEPEFTEQFESNFSYDFPFLTVKSTLINDFFTGVIKTDKYNIKLVGEKGKYKYSGGYRHNFSGFQEQIFFDFQHSGQFKNINFTNQVKNNFYFNDGFSGPEKRISLWANEARYTQGKYYLNSNLKYRENIGPQNEIYATDFDIEFNYNVNEEIFINNQFKLNLVTGSENEKSLNNLFVYSRQLNDILKLIARIDSEYSKSKTKSEPTVFTQNISSLNFFWDFINYDLNFELYQKYSRTDVNNRLKTSKQQKLSAGIVYDFSSLDLAGELILTHYDDKLLNWSLKIKPSQEIDDNFEAWSEFNFELMQNKKEEKYRAAKLSLGMSYSM